MHNQEKWKSVYLDDFNKYYEVSNLEWVTYSENSLHAFKNLLSNTKS